MDCARLCPQCGLDSERTQKGRLPPWEVAKAFAFHTVIAAVCDHLGQAPPELLGKSNDAYIAEQLTLVGGGHPSERAVRAAVVRCRSSSYYPGQPRLARAGPGQPGAGAGPGRPGRAGPGRAASGRPGALARVRCNIWGFRSEE
jgi:hypothetical protein